MLVRRRQVLTLAQTAVTGSLRAWAALRFTLALASLDLGLCLGRPVLGWTICRRLGVRGAGRPWVMVVTRLRVHSSGWQGGAGACEERAVEAPAGVTLRLAGVSACGVRVVVLSWSSRRLAGPATLWRLRRLGMRGELCFLKSRNVAPSQFRRRGLAGLNDRAGVKTSGASRWQRKRLVGAPMHEGDTRSCSCRHTPGTKYGGGAPPRSPRRRGRNGWDRRGHRYKRNCKRSTSAGVQGLSCGRWRLRVP